MRILFFMEKRIDAGSIHAVANYIRYGNELGHKFAVYGRKFAKIPYLSYSTKLDSFDFVIFIFESNLFWPRRLELVHLISRVDRKKRIILDADGMFNPLIIVDKYDRNYWDDDDRTQWINHYLSISDRIIQPSFLTSKNPKVISLPFYGYNPPSNLSFSKYERKKFDILYVGHNWWRWKIFNQKLLPAISNIRDQIDNICFIGLWWDKNSDWAKGTKWDIAYRVDHSLLKRLNIKVKQSVPYTEVIDTMSQSRINIMTQRPLLYELKHITSKYFEIFSADTIPLIMIEPNFAEQIYGPLGRELTIYENIEEKIIDVIKNYKKYKQLVQSIRKHLLQYHSYERRVQELVSSLSQ